jgi:hypothetical protein
MATDNLKSGDQDSSDNIDQGPLSREMLYELVWSEPMLKVAARYGVSSSYMARVCTRLNVPRPKRGYWAKLAVGKAPKVPALPDPQPGDELKWRREDEVYQANRPLPKPPASTPRRRSKEAHSQADEHSLIKGAKVFFEAARTSRDVGYLKPAKRLLVDLVVTKTVLDKALLLANQIFMSLEARGHRVVVAAEAEQFRRDEVEEREKPSRVRHYVDLWLPRRPTVVYIGTVAIGLTLIETSEEVKVRYVRGLYIRESDYVPPRPGRHLVDHTWTTTSDFATGRLCLQAYSPYGRAKWVRHWRESESHDLTVQIPVIVKQLEEAAVEIARLVEDGERQAAIERERWEAEQARWRQEEADRRAAKAVVESKQELIQIINDWAQWQNIELFLADVEQQAVALDPDTRQAVLVRLEGARALLGVGNSIERLKIWKRPQER